MNAASKKKFFSTLINSNVRITNKFKYSLLQCSCAAVHCILIIIFAVLNVYPMMVFNIVSTICYLLCGILVKKEKYIQLYYITYAEICLHSYIAVIMIGWTSGFPLYIIGITPVIFYMHFSLNESNGLGETLLVGFSAMIIFLTCRLISYNSQPIYILTDTQLLYTYIFNSLCTFGIILFFSLLFLREITSSRAELEEQNARLDKMAGIDALTGLLNRRSMDKTIEKVMEANTTFSLIMCDIDNFKVVNDTYGHPCGDAVLKAISEIIVMNIRDNDYVCRWGGEEILLLASDVKIETAYAISERIRCQIEQMRLDFEGKEVQCTITIGIADSTEAPSSDAIIAIADKRLYTGKKSGKNCVVIC